MREDRKRGHRRVEVVVVVRGEEMSVLCAGIDGEGWAPCGPEGPHGAPRSAQRRTGLKPRAPRAAAI